MIPVVTIAVPEVHPGNEQPRTLPVLNNSMANVHDRHDRHVREELQSQCVGE
ncbi:hypothetical protein PPTG_14560 [Phytophthora nicotianae INRA-310]|uniref:Uncharacterized protein n=1 Tax=Phytophthora nicotianae (strain INRA-310) TaxID=761204 RepID=W2PXQ6_PHYN3|nr:hypothetical protein PPTG_14560 [Phytophthora nicotianae INRA-310]ETN04780.1 hypothetical protein PPTG_14560 [Phytophthora nicotianae INRA-310]